MRRILLGGTAAFSLTIGAANAGGMAEPEMAPAVVEASTSSSSGGLVVPLLLLIVVAAIASSNSGGGTQASDRRLKTDITWVGLSPEALPIYRFRYVGMSTRFEGVMAQDVLLRRPDAVVTASNGTMAVDYSKLGARFRVLH